MIMTGGYFSGHVAMLCRLWLAFFSLAFPGGVKYRGKASARFEGDLCGDVAFGDIQASLVTISR
jgi:hypothetical protein